MTQNLAEISLTELAPILAILAGMLIAFYGLLKFMLNQAEKDRNAERNERVELVVAIKDMAESNRAIADKTDKVAEATIQGNLQSAERNGHLGKQNIKITQLVLQAKKETIKAVREVHNQHVDTQIVEAQEVKSGTANL